MLKKNINQITIKDRYSYEDFDQIKLNGFSLQLPEESFLRHIPLSQPIRNKRQSQKFFQMCFSCLRE